MNRRSPILLVGLLALVWSCGDNRGGGTGSHAGMLTLSSGGRLHYEVSGSGDTIVVPGAVAWSAALAPLAQGHTVIFYDPLGRGRSDSAPASRIVLDSIVADLEALRAHFNIGKMGLVGISVNGLVAASYAAAHPDRVARLALINPLPPTAAAHAAYHPAERDARTDTAAQAEMMRMREAGASGDALCRQFWKATGGWFVGDPAAAARIDPAWCGVPNETTDAALMWLGYLSSAAGAWDITPAARAVTAPTLVVRGDRDLWADPAGGQAWARDIAGARLVTLPGVGHFAALEAPDAVNQALKDFFAGGWPAGAAAAAP